MRIPGAAVAVLCIAITHGQSAPPERLIEEAGQALADYRESEAFQLFQQVLNRDPAHLQALVGASWLAGKLSTYSPPGEKRAEYTHKAMTLAEKAYSLAPDHPEVNLVMAWASGGMALISGLDERVRKGLDMKAFIDRAVAGQPEDPRAWYILGQWSRRIAQASVLERAGARLLGKPLPDDVSLEQARDALARAVQGDPDSILYRWEFAQILEELGQTEAARQQLAAADQLTPRTPQDPGLLAQLRYRLKRLSN